MVEIKVGVAKPSGVPLEENLEDRGSSVGIGGPKEAYQIDGKEVTKEEWLPFRQNFEYYKNRKHEKEELNTNNKRHHNDHEEEVGGNQYYNGDLQHEETVSTLQFPIQQPTR